MKIKIYRIFFVVSIVAAMFYFNHGKSDVPKACYLLILGSIFQLMIVEEKLDQ